MTMGNAAMANISTWRKLASPSSACSKSVPTPDAQLCWRADSGQKHGGDLGSKVGDHGDQRAKVHSHVESEALVWP